MWIVVLFAMITIIACLVAELLEALHMRRRIKRANQLRRDYWASRHWFSTEQQRTTVKKDE